MTWNSSMMESWKDTREQQNSWWVCSPSWRYSGKFNYNAYWCAWCLWSPWALERDNTMIEKKDKYYYLFLTKVRSEVVLKFYLLKFAVQTLGRHYALCCRQYLVTVKVICFVIGNWASAPAMLHVICSNIVHLVCIWIFFKREYQLQI